MSSEMIDPLLQTQISGRELEELEGIILRQMFGRGKEIRVLFTGVGLILRGRVGTYYAKQLAQYALQKATKIPLVANEIEVS